MIDKKSRSKVQRTFDHVFHDRKLTKSEMQEMLRRAVENTPPAEPEKEDDNGDEHL